MTQLQQPAFPLRRPALFLFMVCIGSLFLFLGETLFNTRGEPREAVVALSMLQDGNWILPINNGVDMAYKPPLFHWLVALFSLPLGEVTEYTSRLPSAVALTLMVMVGYAFYAKRSGALTALLMGLITLSNFEVHRAGVNCRVDMVLTAMMVVALYQLYRWTEGGFRRLPIWGILALSGAFLSKGPVGAALPCLVMVAFCTLRGHGFWQSLGRFFGIGLLSCVLPLVWYVAAWQQGGQRFLDLVYEENVLRLLGKMSYASHINPWHYNVMTVVTGFVPYTLLVLMSLFVLRYRKPQGNLSSLWNKLKEHVRRVDDVRLFTFLSFALIFVFYCIPKSKRSVYLLPVYPFLAYYLATYMLWLVRRHRRVVVAFGWVVASLAALLPVAFVAVRCGAVPESLMGSGKHAAQNVAMLAALRDTPLNPLEWLGFVVPLIGGGLFVVWRRRPVRVVGGVVAAVFSIFLSLDGLYQPLVLNTKSDKPQAEIVRKYVPEGRVYSYRTHVNPGNPLHPFTINYYLGDRVVPFIEFMPNEGYLLVGDNDIESFYERYPNYRVTEVMDFNHRSCDDRRMLHFYHFQRQ